jgi:hypothetical protein
MAFLYGGAGRLIAKTAVSGPGRDEETKAFRITVGAAVKKGERVHVSLGEKPNSQLLTSYGFVLDQNEYDTVMISMFLNNDDPFYDGPGRARVFKRPQRSP